ncbi:MAG: hypothetical protein JJU03_12655 [Idiomarina sp.]|nr:hypothetical protein [Idiomarina sp.]
MRLKLMALGALLVTSITSYAKSNDQMSIEGVTLNPESIIKGEWIGELESITDYGVVSVGQHAAFIEESEMVGLVETFLGFSTLEAIHAVHIHGVGSAYALDKVTGYSVVFGDEASQNYRIRTYIRDAQQFTLDTSFSGGAVGALDCGSAAKLAILHSPASTEVMSITLGKTFYPRDPKSEEKYADYLSDATMRLARERTH